MRHVPCAHVALLATLLLTRSTTVTGAEKPAGFKVIVNASNPVESLSVVAVSDLFLKRTTRWSNGSPVAPVDLPATSALREEFSREVLGRSAFAVEAYWNKLIYSGQAVPPLTKHSEAEVMAYVKDNPGAVAYVSAGTPLVAGVKALTLTGTR